MNISIDRDLAVEAIFAPSLGQRFIERLTRINALARWASRAMAATREDDARYQDILYRIAISTGNDGILVDRVRDDLATASVFVTRDRIGAILELSDR